MYFIILGGWHFSKLGAAELRVTFIYFEIKPNSFTMIFSKSLKVIERSLLQSERLLSLLSQVRRVFREREKERGRLIIFLDSIPASRLCVPASSRPEGGLPVQPGPLQLPGLLWPLPPLSPHLRPGLAEGDPGTVQLRHPPRHDGHQADPGVDQGQHLPTQP